MVAELLDADRHAWNEIALHQNLVAFDAVVASRIPLGRTQDDFWAWSGERHGLYTVKSAYRLLSEVEMQTRAHATGVPSHSEAASDPRWAKLWKQRLPLKVRVFWWRVMHDFIPCRANLHRRHIDPIANCGICGACEETTYHALVECSLAHGFWRKLKELERIKLPKLRSRTWPEDLLNDTYCSEKDRIIILCGMWSLWNTRNDIHHGKKSIEHTLAIDWALDACFHLLTSQQGSRQIQVNQVARWSPPPEDVVKINCDGGFRVEDMTGSTGAMIRRSDGSFVGAEAS
jgi:hypothetical protein